MTDYEFTEAEQAAIEQAAADHISLFLSDRDAEEVAYDFASAIRGALAKEAVVDASTQLRRVAEDSNTSFDLIEGVEFAADRLLDFAHELTTKPIPEEGN